MHTTTVRSVLLGELETCPFGCKISEDFRGLSIDILVIILEYSGRIRLIPYRLSVRYLFGPRSQSLEQLLDRNKVRKFKHVLYILTDRFLWCVPLSKADSVLSMGRDGRFMMEQKGMKK